jgi:hypothetical protein
MAQYMLIVHDDLKTYAKHTRAEIEVCIEKMGLWSQQMRIAGIHQGAGKLTDDPGKVISHDRVLDGPFAESKELIGGFFLIEAKTESDAINVARECPALPYGSRIEVRMMDDSCQSVLKRSIDA